MLLTHPNQMPELICVIDLATWVAHRLVFVGPASCPWNAEITQIYGSSGSAISTYGCALTRSTRTEAHIYPSGRNACFADGQDGIGIC